MTFPELVKITEGKGYLEYCGNLYEFESNWYEGGAFKIRFLEVNDGHDITRNLSELPSEEYGYCNLSEVSR